MTISGSHASASDETSRPEAPLSPGSAQDGLSSDDLLYDAFISYSRHDLDAAAKIENDLEKTGHITGRSRPVRNLVLRGYRHGN